MRAVLPTHFPHRRARVALAGAALAALLGSAGCAGAPATPAEPAPAAESASGVHSGPAHQAGGAHHGSEALGLYAVQTGPLGVIATDGVGHILYRFDSDSSAPSTSTCVDTCADTWLPLILPEGAEPDLLGVSPDIVATIPRADGGQQITLGGWPLYRHVDDDGLLDSVGAQGADGLWFAIDPYGEKAVIPT